MILSLVISLLLRIDFSQSQNLVPNGSFEEHSNCPYAQSLIALAVPWDIPPGSGTTPDYFHSCAVFSTGCGYVDVPNNFLGSAPAVDGVAYSSIIFTYDYCLNCREYITAPLTTSLVAGTAYTVQMFVRPGDYNKYMTNNQGIYLSNAPVYQPGNQPITSVTPQIENTSVIDDTSQWTSVSGVYIAAGGEQYITIGNFHDSTTTIVETVNYPGGNCLLVTGGAMYMIDSVYVGIAGNFPSAIFSSTDSSFCEEMCIDFTDISANAPTSWQWYFPGGNPSSSIDQNPANICYSTPGNYDVVLIATNATGSDTTALTNFISVNAFPSTSITQSNDTLFATGGMSFQWYLNGSMIPGATNDYYVASVQGDYSVSVADSNGCVAADTSIFNPAAFSAIDTSLCQKFCTDFTDLSYNNPTSWLWSFPGGTPSSSTSQNPTGICYQVPGTYDVTLITTNTSGNDTLTLIGYVTVYPTPAFPTITQNGYTLTSSPASAYQWQFNSADIPGATNQSFDVQMTGYYTIIITDENGCSSAATVYIVIEGITEHTEDAIISIYPNPTSGNFIIYFSGNSEIGEAQINIYNTLGQLVFNSETFINSHNHKTEISLRDLLRGVYFVEITSEKTFYRGKVVLAR